MTRREGSSWLADAIRDEARFAEVVRVLRGTEREALLAVADAARRVVERRPHEGAAMQVGELADALRALDGGAS